MLLGGRLYIGYISRRTMAVVLETPRRNTKTEIACLHIRL